MSKSQAFSIIENAILVAKQQGIEIVRNPLFDWTGPDKSIPKACDSTGAVLLTLHLEKRPKGWIYSLADHLGVNSYWIWCFWHGWDHGHIILNPIKNDKNIITNWSEDDISKNADKMAKRFCGKK